MEPTTVAPQQPRPRPCYKFYMFFLIYTSKECFKTLFLLAQYQAIPGQNHQKFYSFRKGASQRTEPTAVVPQQPRPRPC
jgi:hypothetical protein